MTGETTDPAPTVDHDPPTHVTVVGETVAVVPLDDESSATEADDSRATVEMGFSCDTGTSASGLWRGRSLSSLLDAVSMPDETTHLVLRATDGFQVCVPIATALRGVVATTLDGHPIDDAHTRFVAPALDSARCIRDVAVVEPVHLDPEEARDDYESIGG
jgi:DMSO/TMAO reductase YedYZ molybdopterin-dependent catalytic subunit